MQSPSESPKMTQVTHRRPQSGLTGAPALVAAFFARPKVLALVCVAALAAAGWVYLGLMVASAVGAGHGGALGPGMGLLDYLLSPGEADSLTRAVIDALCRPTFGAAQAAHFGMPLSDSWSATDFALILVMWCAMALAMMLPTAGPMIVTYAEIADTAARKGEHAVSPLVIAGGYTAVWLGFALAATVLQWGLTQAALLDPAMATTSGLFSGVVFVGAGLYQFSALKHACVTQCQRPFPFFFANWTTSARGVWGLGVRQGLFCLGCCWAMMLVMFAVGLMNVLWMAGLGVIMTLEKVATTTRFSRIIGAAFIAVGVVLIAASVAAHWPAQM